MLCDFIPDHHRGGPKIANKTTVTIGTTARAMRPSSSTGRPCCGRAVRFLGFVIRALHLVRDGRYFEAYRNYYVTRNYGKRPFGKLIRNYVYYQLSGDFAAIPPGMKRRILYWCTRYI